MTISKADLDASIQKQKTSFLDDFRRIVQSPSISCIPEHKKDVEETAKIGAELLKAAGAEVVKTYKTKGNPVVFGRFENKKGAPTVAVYNHLDVQPAAKGKDGWSREPFKFTEDNGRFYSRGTTDDKGPAMTALLGAKLAREFGVQTNIEFIWELEEEIGSPNFAEFLDQAKGEIKAQTVLVSDTLWLSPETPPITRGLRGLLGMVVRLRTGKVDVHSGVAGGAARNPIAELCGLVSKCVDAATGEITIPGVEKTWKKPTADELEDYVRSGFSAEKFKSVNQLTSLRVNNAASTIEKIWFSPTFEVHGIAGGYQDHGIKTIVPPFGELKVSMRLVPGQDPNEIFKLFKNHAMTIIPDCEIEIEGILNPYLAPPDMPQNKFIAEALKFGFGMTPAPIREGGSIGPVVTMAEKLKVPILFMGMSLPQDSYHGPDESFAWRQIEGGAKAFAKYFELLGT